MKFDWNALTLNLDPPNARCDSVVLQETCVPDRSELVAIPYNTDGFTSSPWFIDSSQHLQNVTHSSTSQEERNEPKLNVILIVASNV